MSACSFTVPFTTDAETVLSKAKHLVEKNGGNFNGDVNAGDFSLSVFGNSISGNYSVSSNELSMVITDKPFMIPCSMIESMLADQLNK